MDFPWSSHVFAHVEDFLWKVIHGIPLSINLGPPFCRIAKQKKTKIVFNVVGLC